MAIRTEPSLFDFTVEEALETLDGVESALRVVAEYDVDSYTDVYVSDAVVEDAGGQAAYADQRDLIAEYLRMDFLERNAYLDVVPRVGEAELFVTRGEHVTFLRLFRDERALLVAVDAGASLDELVEDAETLADR